MQEHIQQRTVAVTVQAARFSGKILFKIARFLLGLPFRLIKKGIRNQANPKLHTQKQSLKNLLKHNKTVNSMDLNDPEIKLFNRIARKYRVNYSVLESKSANKSGLKSYTIVFHADHADLMKATFKEYMAAVMLNKAKQAVPKVSILQRLEHFKSITQNLLKNIRSKHQEKSR